MYARHGALAKDQHHIEGINSRMDGLQAAILLAKIPYIPRWTNQRIVNDAYYNQLLANMPQIILPFIRSLSKTHTICSLFVAKIDSNLPFF